MGSSKKRIQSKAENRAQQTTALEHQRAQELEDRLGSLRGIGEEVSKTGGYDTGQVDIGRGAIGKILGDEGYSGAGREYYEDFAKTGGFTPESSENFIRRATGVVPAMYARQKDDLSRRLALQGGYMPGFTTSEARLQRHGAQEGAKATLDAQTELATLIRQGKLAGVSGLERTRAASGQERLGAIGALTSLEGGVAAGKRAGAGIISEAERIGITNRLASAGVSQQEIDTLMNLAAQKPGLFERIKDILGMASGAAMGAIGIGGPGIGLGN